MFDKNYGKFEINNEDVLTTKQIISISLFVLVWLFTWQHIKPLWVT